MIDYERARKAMVDTQLRTNNVTDRRILSVMGRVPRELFVPEARRELAYIDDELPLTNGTPPRYLSAPTPFGKLIQLAEIGPSDRVLDVGAGTGYSTAVLAELCGSVVGLEDDAGLANQAGQTLSGLGFVSAEIVAGGLDATVPGLGVFDAIVVEGAVEKVPEVLFDALADGGRLVALVREGVVGVAYLHVRTGEGISARAAFDANLPPLETQRRPTEFVF